MAISETLMALDDAITELDAAIQKAWLMTDELSVKHFNLKRKEIIYYDHERAGIKNSISLDYIVQISELIKTARKLLDIGWEAAKEREES